MQNSPTEIIILTIAITTIFLCIVGAIAVRYVFLYQQKRFRHRQEVTDMRETFNNTLLQSKLEIKEQTLDQVAKELHASVGHSVSLIQIEMEELSMQIPASLKENTLRIQDLIQQLFGELQAVNSLNTDHIMYIGFIKAFDNEMARLLKTKKYLINFVKEGTEFALHPEDEIILFRLCQEILNNIVRYAHAKIITIGMTYTESVLILEITDDGKGFNVTEALKQSGAKVSTGLINIQKRAKLINADITFKSILGEGTTFIIQIPKIPFNR